MGPDSFSTEQIEYANSFDQTITKVVRFFRFPMRNSSDWISYNERIELNYKELAEQSELKDIRVLKLKLKVRKGRRIKESH